MAFRVCALRSKCYVWTCLLSGSGSLLHAPGQRRLEVPRRPHRVVGAEQRAKRMPADHPRTVGHTQQTSRPDQASKQASKQASCVHAWSRGRPSRRCTDRAWEILSDATVYHVCR
ncbi:hypothetical protein BKA81DRAFT_70205 [Phyllosticta paracitricarpa]